MIRLARRGALPGPSIISAPCRPTAERRSRQRPSQCSCTVSIARCFSVLRQVQKQTDNRFFWPSRPDFLPSKAPNAGSSVGVERNKERRLLVQQAYRRFRPLGNAHPTLPPPESITYLHAPLYTSIAKGEVDSAWTHFVAHLGNLSKGTAVTLASALFDALFWLVAAENFTSTLRHEEVFGRVEILLLYATSQADYGFTRLQLHRTFYIWTSLWEQYDVDKLPFTQSHFAETIISRLNELDSRLASRIFSRMVNACNTPEEMGEVAEKIKSWLKEGRCEVPRQETWTSSSRNEMVNDDAFFREEDRGALDSEMWNVLLQKCFHIGTSKQTTDAGLMALQQAQLDPSLDCVSQFLASLPLARLYDLLPADVRRGVAEMKDALIIPLDPHTPVLGGKHDKYFTEERKISLVYAVAFVLATRKHYQAALYLFELDSAKDKGNDAGKKTDHSVKKAEVYTAAANACARLALNGDPAKPKKLQDPGWTLIQLQRGLRLFVNCDWFESRSKYATAKTFIDAILECIRLDKAKAAAQSNAQWLLLLRQFTTVLLSHDPHLTTLQIAEDITAYSHLIRLHIHLQDYPFAKRLFLVTSLQEAQMEDFLGHGDFLWLFEHSMEKETGARFTNQLFLYWTGLNVGENAALEQWTIPPSLLRMYFWKLKKIGKEGSAIKRLHDTLNLQNLSGKSRRYPDRGKIYSSHALRLMRTYFMVEKDSIELSLSMAEDLVRLWKEKKKQWPAILVELYSIALKRSTHWIEQSDPLLRSKILAFFASFEEHFASLHTFQRFSLTRTNKEDVATAFSSALSVLVEEKQARPTGAIADKWISGLRRKWGFREVGSHIWSLRIQAHLVGSDADVDNARALYAQAVSILDAKNSLEGGQQVLSPSVTSTLMIALAERGQYDDAREYASIYQNHAGPLPPTSRAFIEGASIAVLHMQGNVEEALQRLETLQEDGKIRGRKADATWLKIVGKVTARLKEQTKKQKEERLHEHQDYDLPVVLSEQEEERARVYGAMASGQPWRRRRES